MRLALIQNLYPNYIKDFEDLNASELVSYQSCLNLLQEDCFSWNGAWGKELAKYDFEVFELYVNYDKLNYYWCLENGFDKARLSIEDILIEQLKAFKIDLVLNTDVKTLRTPFIRRIKDIKNIKGVFAHVCSPYFSKFDLVEYTGIFACVHHFVELFESYNIPSFYLPHCFNLSILEKISSTVKLPIVNSVLFAGGVIKGQDLHDDREKLLLEFLHKEVPLAFFSELFYHNRAKSSGIVLAKKTVYHMIKILRKAGVRDDTINKLPILKDGLSWKHLPGDLVNRELVKIAQKPLYGLDFYSKLQNYSISLNIHAGAAKDEAANMRLFEVTGIGAALVTDYKSNLSDFFDVENEIVAYKSIPEAVEKSKYLLDNPTVAARIGHAGQQRILKDHTFKNRAPIIAENILKLI